MARPRNRETQRPFSFQSPAPLLLWKNKNKNVRLIVFVFLCVQHESDQHACQRPRPHQPRLLFPLRSPQFRRPRSQQPLPRRRRRFLRLISLISFLASFFFSLSSIYIAFPFLFNDCVAQNYLLVNNLFLLIIYMQMPNSGNYCVV